MAGRSATAGGTTLFHVEWNVGVITGRFEASQAVAMALANQQAEKTGKATKVTPVTLPACDPATIALLLNDSEMALEWHDDEAVTVSPPPKGL